MLSPAAYFVDLLHFIDPEAGPRATEQGTTPYDVLIEQRPDLKTLRLTCENTHTALPYIDVVNEILEGYIQAGLTPPTDAHNVGAIASADLIAEPEHVVDSVYDGLRDEKYPIAAPFDLWTATVRVFLSPFELSFADVLRIFGRPSLMFNAAGTVSPPDRASILAEAIGLSAAEYRLLVGAGAAPFDWRTLYGLAAGDPLSAVNANVRVLTKRLDVEVKDLVALFQTRFVNPELSGFRLLQKLGITAQEIFRFKGAAGYPALTADEQTTLAARLAAVTMPDGSSGTVWVDARWAAGAFDRLALIWRPSDGCDTELMVPMFAASRTPVDEAVLLRLNVMTRLWKKLGWTLEELDEALHVFLPKPFTGAMADLGTGLRSALVGIAHVQMLADRYAVRKPARLTLLSLWADVSTYGRQPLYAHLFLASASPADRVVFDHQAGEYLSDNARLLKDHLAAVQAACGASAADVAEILSDAGLTQGGAAVTLDNARLSLPVVSAVHRYALLARMLKLRVPELVQVRRLSGLRPFEPPRSGGVTAASEDFIGEHTVALAAAVDTLRSNGLTVDQLQYLLLDRVEAESPRRRSPSVLAAGLRALAEALQRARTDHQLPSRLEDVSSDFLKPRLALLYPEEVLTPFLAMLDGSIRYTASVAASNATVTPPQLAAYPELSPSFNPVRDRQALTATGVISDARRTAAVGDVAALAPLLADIDRQARDFFAHLLDREPPPMFGAPGAPAVDVGAAIRAGLSFDALFNGTLEPAARRAAVAAVLLPITQRLAEQRAAVQTLAVVTGRDPAVIDAFAKDPALTLEPPVGGGVQPRLVDSLMLAVRRGVRAEYFSQNDLTGPLADVMQDAADLAAAPALARSAKLTGTFTVPESGAYRFDYTSGRSGEQFALTLSAFADRDLSGAAATDGAVASGPVRDLLKDVQYSFVAEVRGLAVQVGQFGVRAESDPTIRSFADLECWPQAAVTTFSKSLARIDRLTLLMERLNLTAPELQHLLAYPADFGPRSLAALPLEEVASPTTVTNELMQTLVGLATYCRCRDRVSATSEAMVGALGLAHRRLSASLADGEVRTRAAADLTTALASALGAPVTEVRAAVSALGFDASAAAPVVAEAGIKRVDFVELVGAKGLARLIDLLEVAQRLGVSPSAVAQWATPGPSMQTAMAVRAAIKSRYGADAWRQAVKPLADSLRRQRRDALARHLIWKKGYSTIADIYEHLLIDPEMEPAVLTSRLRVGIATVQTFINKCLEKRVPGVDPSKIDAQRWRYMKNYRPWEAARRILLFAANWAHPEFYDDASPILTSMLGTLLQSDLDTDAVEAAFFEYLAGLEQVARLQMMAMYVEDKGTAHTADDVVHVIGRTFSSPHKYFHRTLANGTWSPWNPVGADIEGNHVMAVMWRERLHLFWVTVVERTRSPEQETGTSFEDAAGNDVSATQAITDLELRLNWCQYVKGEWRPRQSAGTGEVLVLADTSAYRPDRLFVKVRKEFNGDEEAGVRVAVFYSAGASWGSFFVRSAHAPAEIDGRLYRSGATFPFAGFEADGFTRWTSDEPGLRLLYTALLPDDLKKITKPTFRVFEGLPGHTAAVLPATFEDGPLPATHPLDWPFFFEDNSNTLFGVPQVEEHLFTEPSAGYHDLDRHVGRYKEQTPPSKRFAAVDPRVRADRTPPPEPDAVLINPVPEDWLTDAGTVIAIGDRYVGPRGSFDVAELTAVGKTAGRVPSSAGTIARDVAESPGGFARNLSVVGVTENREDTTTLSNLIEERGAGAPRR